MLSEEEIDVLIQPLVMRQRQIEGVVLRVIAERLNDIRSMTPSDIYKLQQLYRSSNDVKAINKELAKLTDLSEKDIRWIIREVAKDNYKDAKAFYDYTNTSYLPFDENIQLQRAIESVSRVTLETYRNLSNSTAFMVRNMSTGLLMPTRLSLVYDEVIDTAIQMVATGYDSYNQVIPKLIKSLTESGIKTVEYNQADGSKRFVRLDSVVRRNILDGIRDITQESQNIVGEQFGADGIELSVHQYSAPDHEPVQGHQFTKEQFENMQNGIDFEDTNGITFEGFERPIGQWNCRHIAWNIVIGHKTPNYTLEQLEKIKEKNANGIIAHDREGNEVLKSMYWCTQKQRQYELAIRQARELMDMAEKAGQEELYNKANMRVDTLLDQYTIFSRQCGLRPKYNKTISYI